jgi:hypothetical protein
MLDGTVIQMLMESENKQSERYGARQAGMIALFTRPFM